MKKCLSLLLAVLMCVSMFSFGMTSAFAADDTPLVVGYSPFNSKFSPFFATTAYDQDAQQLTQLPLLTSDRTGAVILNGIEGETVPYNGTDYTYYGPADCVITENEDGTVYYDFTLRDDLVFSDGEPLTIDDVIFSMYVFCDPTYDGSSTLNAQPILGLDKYISGVEARGSVILAAGDAGYEANDLYTEEQYNTFWDYYNNQAGTDFAQEIVDFCIGRGYNSPDDSVAACAANWGFELAEDATAEDFWAAIVEAYGGDIDTAVATETAGSDLLGLTVAALGEDYQAGVQTGDSAKNIEGIQKIDDTHLRVVLTKVDATAIYQLALNVAPLHYYGDPSLYDYDNNSFGFPKGDLSLVAEVFRVFLFKPDPVIILIFIPLFKSDDQIYALCLSYRRYTEQHLNIHSSDTAKFYKVSRYIGSCTYERIIADFSYLNNIVAYESVSSLNKFQGCFGLTYAALAGYKNTFAVYIDKYSVNRDHRCKLDIQPPDYLRHQVGC